MGWKHGLGLLLTAMILMLFCSCEKGESASGDDKPIEGTGHLVTLRAVLPANIYYENEEPEAQPASLGEYLTNITFAIFQDDQRLYISHQQAGGSNYGTYQVRLERGTYQLVAIAHNDADHPTVNKPNEIKFANNKVTETFYAYTTLEVSSQMDRTITLERAVAKVQYYCKDPIPADVAQMKFYYTGGSSTFDATTGFGCVNSRQTEYREITAEMIGHPVVFPIFTFPHDTEGQLKLVVTALDSGGNELREATYQTVPIALNEVTVMEKYFFTQSDYTETTEIEFTLRNEGDWSQINMAY